MLDIQQTGAETRKPERPTAEIRKPRCCIEKCLANIAKEYLETVYHPGANISLSRLQKGKYFRVIADVSFRGYDSATAMLQRGLAVEYEGTGLRHDWCIRKQPELIKKNIVKHCDICSLEEYI